MKASHVLTVTPAQAEQLRAILENRGWSFDSMPHARWRARRDKTTAVAYQSGKLVIQGKGTAELVQFVIEPEITGQARFGYEHKLAAAENPAMLEPHIGIDESGKGDYFGPLVVAAVYVERKTAEALLGLGVRDSKAIGGDRKIAELAPRIREIVNPHYSLVSVGPEAYNRLYEKFGNLNRLLAWGHARALEDLLEKVPDCPRAVSDKFAHESAVRNALQERGRAIELTQVVRAEADVAVAAASILARAEFVERLRTLGEKYGMELPKGAGGRISTVGRALVGQAGADALQHTAKLHFRTTAEILRQL